MTGPTGGDKAAPFGRTKKQGYAPPLSIPRGTASRRVGRELVEWLNFIRVSESSGKAVINLSRDRIVITGVPSALKTTIAKELKKIDHDSMTPFPLRLLHTDTLKDTHKWGDDSLEVSHWFDAPGPWIIEGVTAVRALRKWMKNHPEGKPCDAVLWMGEPVVPIEGRVLGLAKGCRTVWNGIEAELVERGVEILSPKREA